MALAVPLSRFTSQVGGGSAFYVRPHHTSMTAVLLLPFIVLGIGIALLIGGERTKDRVAGGVLRVIGVLVIILSLACFGGCYLASSHLHPKM